MKVIPLKNYIILFFVVVCTVLLTMFLSSYYRKINTKYSIMYENISQITEKELTDYIIEKPVIYMYIADKENLTVEEFEKEFLKYIKNINVKDDFVYLDKKTITDEFKNFFVDNYQLDIDLEKEIILITINDGEIIKTQYVDKNKYNFSELISVEGVR